MSIVAPGARPRSISDRQPRRTKDATSQVGIAAMLPAARRKGPRAHDTIPSQLAKVIVPATLGGGDPDAQHGTIKVLRAARG